MWLPSPPSSSDAAPSRRGAPVDTGRRSGSVWHGPLAALQANLTDLAARYCKDLVVVETAYPWTTGNGDALANSFTSADQLPDAAAYPPTRAGQARYFEALRQVIAQVPGGHGTGFFDWDGAALPALRAFRPPQRSGG